MPKNSKGEIDESKIKVIHIMADGTIRNSVYGYEIPYNEQTAIAYQLLAKWNNEQQKKTYINIKDWKTGDVILWLENLQE